MSDADSADSGHDSDQTVIRGIPSAFEQLITTKPPVLESLLAQLPTESILALYYTSSFLKQFFKNSPTSWRYISMRLNQPAVQASTPTANGQNNPNARQSSNYSLDKMLLYVIHPFSTRLTNLELDNTSVSGATVFQTVMARRTDTLEHVSVRGCKNVSLKYHINPWLMMHAMALDRPAGERPPGYEKLALKSLYTYRCRHHRRRPYLPSSLARKESDSEPTHELVLTCHKLGIWTDTAWCTTPGARCYRRRGYVTMRVPQDPREVWVVFDRLWRSRNWLGPLPDPRQSSGSSGSDRRGKKDCRSWEADEEAMNGEPLGTTGDGKTTPAHARKTHKQFVEDIYCYNCSDPILERCEQCSVMMHCSGCRKTLCASCAFDRPYLRNKTAPPEERNKIWWAPGCAVSPCSMLDQDSPPPGPVGNAVQAQQAVSLPTIKFKWCCTEPVFSGGGGITFGSTAARESDRIRAAPLRMGQGWEDPEFFSHHDACADDADSSTTEQQQIGLPLSRTDAMSGMIGGRWPSMDNLFQPDSSYSSDQASTNIPRILCDECYASDQWKIKCKACSLPLCLKHDVKERLKVRICGYKDLNVEKAEYKSRQKALKLLISTLRKRYGKVKAAEEKETAEKQVMKGNDQDAGVESSSLSDDLSGLETPRPSRNTNASTMVNPANLEALIQQDRTHVSDSDTPARPVSPGSNSTGPPSRATSPTPSARSIPATPEPNNVSRQARTESDPPLWRGCQSFFCPSTRTPGDHRRRCVGIMRQCFECKIHVCEQCTTGLPPLCRCNGCRSTSVEGQPNEVLADPTQRFFCPNCRWSRRKTGKCKRKITDTKAKSPKKKVSNPKQQKRLSRPRKPIEERQSHLSAQLGTDTTDSESVYEHISEFMELLDLTTSSNTGNETPLVAPSEQTGVNDNNSAVTNADVNLEDIQQLADMGALARDLIERIQVLRQQFGPGSAAARALPNITVQDPVLRAVQEQVEASSSQQPQLGNSTGTTPTSSGPAHPLPSLPVHNNVDESMPTEEIQHEQDENDELSHNVTASQ